MNGRHSKRRHASRRVADLIENASLLPPAAEQKPLYRQKKHVSSFGLNETTLF
jgi:hypothetical protein